MEQVLVDFCNAPIEEQMMMFRNLSTRLKLLGVKNFKRNPDALSNKMISEILIDRLIYLYNNAKSEEIREFIRSDSFYQKIMRKGCISNNCKIKNTQFEKDFDLIIKEVFGVDLNVSPHVMRFINRYSSNYICKTNDINLSNIKIFFENKDKEHNFPVNVLNGLHPDVLLEIYKYYIELDDKFVKYDLSEGDIDSFVRNKYDMEKYLKKNFCYNGDLYKIARNLINGKYVLSLYNKSRLNYEHVELLLCLYFQYYQPTNKDANEIVDYFVKRYQNVKFDSEYTDLLKHLLKLNLKTDVSKVIKLMYGYCYHINIKSLIVILYFNFLSIKDNIIYSFEYLNEYSISFLLKLNYLHLKNIFNAIDKIVYGDEIMYGFRLAINMYFAFGYNRTLDILNGKYGNLSKDFFNNISKIKISDNFLDENNNVVLKKGYINTLFNEEKNSNFTKIINDYSMSNLIHILYNDYEDIIKKYGKLNLKLCNDLLVEKNKINVKPKNNALLRADIKNTIIVGNRRNVDLNVLIKKIEEIFEKQQKRISSSIPYLEGECEEYIYKMMRFNDPIIYNLGYIADCCFRITDVGEIDLKHAALDKNARILLIYDNKSQIIAFSVLNRNGDVIIVTSVEYCGIGKNISKEKLLKVLKKFSIELYDKMNAADDTIKLITIGANSKIKPLENIPFPSKYITPMCAKEDEYQANIYHKRQHILLVNNDTDLGSLKYDIDVKEYFDPRLKIQRVVIDEENINKYKILIARINNSYNDTVLSLEDVLIFNDDWYLLIKKDGKIFSNYLDYDKRALEELNVVKNCVLESDNKYIYSSDFNEVEKLLVKSRI